MFTPEDVADGRREERINIAPGEKHQSGERDEPDGVVHKYCERRNGHSFKNEHHSHRVVATEMIGDPAKEGARRAVQRLIEQHCQGQNGGSTKESVLVKAVCFTYWF